MEKKITIDYQEYLSIQDEIKKLKEANSALCQGAPVLEVNEFCYNANMLLMSSMLTSSVISRYEGLVSVAERFVVKGHEKGVLFEGVELLIAELKRGIREVDDVNNSKQEELISTRARIKNILNRSLWQRIMNKHQ